MLTVANECLVTLKKTDPTKTKDITDYLTKIGGLLYLKGSLLPEVEIRNPEYNERFKHIL
jgi:hypothetical protein